MNAFKSKGYESWFGQKMMVNQDRKLAKHPEDQHWEKASVVRNSLIEDKAKQEVRISAFQLKHYLAGKGLPSREITSVSQESIDRMQLAIKKGTAATNEVSFAAGSVLEGMLELFGLEQRKEVLKYKDRLHAIETENGSYIGKLDKDGNVKVLSGLFPSKEKAVDQLNEFHQSVQKKKQRGLDAQRELSIEDNA